MGGFCSFANAMTFSAFCARKHLEKLVSECILPREQQMRLNPCTDRVSGEKGGGAGEEGTDRCVAMSYSSLN